MATVKGPDGRGEMLPRGSGRTGLDDEGSRRLQRMGAVTVGVSLPKAWIARHGLTVGDPVRLRPLPDDSLVLRADRPASAPTRAEVDVDPGAPPEHVFRNLIGAYLAGAGEFEVAEAGGLRPETRQIARTFARRTLQIEIVSEEAERMVLRDVSRGADLALAPLLRRMLQVVVDLQQQAGAAGDSGETSGAGSLGGRDDEVDRYAWLVERVLAMRLAPGAIGEHPPTPDESPLDHLVLARYLERVADHAVRIAEVRGRLAGSRIPNRFEAALSEHHRQILNALKAAVDVTERPDARRANEVIDTTEALHQTHDALREDLLARGRPADLTPSVAAGLSLLLESLDRTTAYAQDIAQVGLDRAARASLAPPPRAALPGVRRDRVAGRPPRNAPRPRRAPGPAA